MAIALHQKNSLREAEMMYREVLYEDPENADAFHLIGLIEHQRGNHRLAMKAVDQAILFNSNIAMYHVNRVRILRALGFGFEAVNAAHFALSLDTDNAETYCELAGALLDIENYTEALIAAQQGYQLAPDMIEVRKNLAIAHFGEGQLNQNNKKYDIAENHYRRAVELVPDMVEAIVNLGNVLRSLSRLEEAQTCYQRAVALNSDIPEVYVNMGVVTQEQGDTKTAIEFYDIALDQDPENAEIRRNRAQALLKIGQFQEGWKEFEWRWKTKHFDRIRRTWQSPQWKGQNLRGKVILVHAEQGFGDSIQCARYLPLLAKISSKVVVECPEVLMGLISRVEGVAQTIKLGEEFPAHDYNIPMMSLPGAFNTNFDNFPNKIPYFIISEAEQHKWQERIIVNDDRPCLGLVWRGSDRHERNEWRSPGLKTFENLVKMGNYQWISLQKDFEEFDLSRFKFNENLLALGHQFENFVDTASTIINLDLVISPDTAVAHLAGALGKPIWLILPYANEWRWFENRTDSPWYPTLKIFRQHVRDDWSGPVADIAAELKRHF